MLFRSREVITDSEGGNPRYMFGKLHGSRFWNDRKRTNTQRANSKSAIVKAEVLTMSSSSNSHKTTAPMTGRKRIQVRMGNVDASSSNITVLYSCIMS